MCVFSVEDAVISNIRPTGRPSPIGRVSKRSLLNPARWNRLAFIGWPWVVIPPPSAPHNEIDPVPFEAVNVSEDPLPIAIGVSIAMVPVVPSVAQIETAVFVKLVKTDALILHVVVSEQFGAETLASIAVPPLATIVTLSGSKSHSPRWPSDADVTTRPLLTPRFIFPGRLDKAAVAPFNTAFDRNTSIKNRRTIGPDDDLASIATIPGIGVNLRIFIDPGNFRIMKRLLALKASSN